MTDQEIEDKYNALASALKLDKYTLRKRIELMRHQRDQSEESMARELTEIQHCLQVRDLFNGNSRHSSNWDLKIHRHD